jgi:WbqC-like protein family
MTIVAIHQPNFFPWLGYFDKIARSDVFILLDHVQFQKTGGTWSNRVKLLMNGEARWVTAPVDRSFHGVRPICEMEFQADQPWREKLLKSLTTNYAQAPFFRETMACIEPLVLNPENNLARYNGDAVMAIAKQLGLPSEKFRWSSELGADEQASEMLISLTRTVGCDVYMCGGGAAGYQDDAAFAAAGVDLVYQNYQHPVYPQVGAKKFVAGLSIIDVAMNLGWSGVKALLSRELNASL